MLSRFKASTAQITARDLIRRGIPREEFSGEHIRHVYASTRKLSSQPDFESINGILPDAPLTQTDKNSACGIIVETRKHADLERVIQNFIENTHIPVQLFHGRSNLDFIMSTAIAEQVDKGNVHLTGLNIDDLSAGRYNALFLSKKFWEHVMGRNKIVVFQTDTILCRDSDYALNDFLSFDYIGSKWPRFRPIGLVIDGGNGGLSIRDWSMTYDCLTRFPSQYWTGGEDGYFAFHIDLMGGKVGKPDECAKFSSHVDFSFKSWGAHQISCLNSKDKKAFIKYCEDAHFLL